MPFSSHGSVCHSAVRPCGAAAVVLLALLLPVVAGAQCIEGNCVNGSGTKITRGQKYTGEFVNNHRQGKGTYYFTDGSVYSGDWVEGVMQGQGEYRFPNGDVYRGAFKDGKRDGQGTYYFTSGEMLSGLWKGNQLVMEGEGLETKGVELQSSELPAGGEAAGNETAAGQNNASDADLISLPPGDNAATPEPPAGAAPDSGWQWQPQPGQPESETPPAVAPDSQMNPGQEGLPGGEPEDRVVP